MDYPAQPTTTDDRPLLPALSMPQRTLMGPGPSNVPGPVLDAMTQPVVGHLDPAFIEIMDGVQTLLRYLFQTENELTIPISGTGSAAMEAAVANLVEPGDDVLVCINGYFGGRIAEMARRYGADVRTVEREWGEIVPASAVEEALQRRPASVVGIVHGETSTGVAQPLGEVVKVAHEHGAMVIVDTVASLGGAPLRVDELGIDVCYSGSQKCLSAPPGASPITLSAQAVRRIEKRQTPVANWYLDLLLLRRYWGEERAYHHTAPISTVYALYEALRLVAEEGLEARWQRHQDVAEQLWEGLAELGMSPLVPREYRLPPLTTVQVGHLEDEGAIRSRLMDEYNIEIAGGLGALAGEVWRVGLMGHSARPENVSHLLTALRELLPDA